MASIAEPDLALDKSAIGGRRPAEHGNPKGRLANRAKPRHIRSEIVGLIAFGLVLLAVFLMRNYAS
jgi:hypothetical protein